MPPDDGSQFVSMLRALTRGDKAVLCLDPDDMTTTYVVRVVSNPFTRTGGGSSHGRGDLALTFETVES